MEESVKKDIKDGEERENPAEEEKEEKAESAPEESGEEDGFEDKSKKEKAPKGKKAELEKVKAERDEYLAALIRERADFENYKKRNSAAVSRAFSDGKADALLAILPVIDNFDRAADTPCTDEAYKNGVDLVHRQLVDAVKSMGAEEIEALSQPFDPAFHNAVSQVPCEEGEESGVVKNVLMKGYKIGDKVLRHAMVQVTE